MSFLKISSPYELKDLNKEAEDQSVIKNEQDRKNFSLLDIKDEYFEITEADRQMMKIEIKRQLKEHPDFFAQFNPDWLMCPRCKEWTQESDKCCD
jgi:hypothetical protein